MITVRGCRRRSAGLVGLLLIMVMITGCVSVPTSGPVQKAGDAGRASVPKSEIVPKPPVKDASPRVIVDGFLLAMSQYQANYQTARKFLTPEANQSWRPDDKITVFSNPKYNSADNNITLTMSRVGQVDADGAYTATFGPQVQNFQITKNSAGQWRISNPPNGLLISETSFISQYKSYNLYFFDPQFSTLVPDPIYLPTDGQTETALVQALLRGATSWLQPAVTTGFPPRTSLVGNSVPVTGNGYAQISLSPGVESLNSSQRSWIAAQLAWTLRQTTDDLKGFQITVNGNRLQVPNDQGDGQNAYVPINYGPDFAPVPASDDTLMGVRDGVVVTVSNDGAKVVPIAGRLGHPGYDIASMALSSDGRTVAAVTAGRTKLVTQVLGESTVRVIDQPRIDLLRPDFTRSGELWAISGAPGKQSIRMYKNGKTTSVQAPWLSRMQVTNFRISPEGSRMAIVAKSGKNEMLAVAPISRGDKVTMGNLRFISLNDGTSAQVRQIADLGWTSPTQLLTLGAASSTAAYEPYRVAIDGSQFERLGASDGWGATVLATRVDPSGSFQAVVGGRGDKAWIYRSGDEWSQLTDKLTAPTYAG